MNILRSVLLVLMLSACGQSTAVQQAGVVNQSYVTRAEFDALYAEASRQILSLNNLVETKTVDITNLQKQNNLLTTKNTDFSNDIKRLNFLLEAKNDVDRRVMALWGKDNWFWVHECANSWAASLGLSLCQFTDSQYKRAEEMVGKGYPIEPTKILLRMPFAFGYTLLIYSIFILIFILLLWGLLRLAVRTLENPCKGIWFEVNSSYRTKVMRKFEEANLPYKEEAKQILLNIKNSLLELDDVKSDIKKATNVLYGQREIISQNKLILKESESLIDTTKREYLKIVSNCIDHFLNEADHREKYIQKMRNYLMDPLTRDFEGFTGMEPTETTLMTIKASELKQSKPIQDWVDEDE